MKICFKRNVYHFKWIKINKLFVPWHDYFWEISVIIYFSSRISTVVLATTELGLGTILQRQMCTNHTHLQFMLQTYSCTLLNSVRRLNIYVHLRMHKIIKWHTIMVHAVKKKNNFLKGNLGCSKCVCRCHSFRYKELHVSCDNLIFIFVVISDITELSHCGHIWECIAQ